MGRKFVANSQAGERREMTRNYFLSSFSGISKSMQRGPLEEIFSITRLLWVRSLKCEEQFHGHEAGNAVPGTVYRRQARLNYLRLGDIIKGVFEIND
jgi:hypothetical protein